MAAIAGPVWGFLGTLVAAAVALLTALGVAIYNKRHDAPHVEREDELEGLRASVDAILPVVAALRSELSASEKKHEQCQAELVVKSNQITQLSLELLHFHRMMEGKADR